MPKLPLLPTTTSSDVGGRKQDELSGARKFAHTLTMAVCLAGVTIPPPRGSPCTRTAG